MHIHTIEYEYSRKKQFLNAAKIRTSFQISLNIGNDGWIMVGNTHFQKFQTSLIKFRIYEICDWDVNHRNVKCWWWQLSFGVICHRSKNYHIREVWCCQPNLWPYIRVHYDDFISYTLYVYAVRMDQHRTSHLTFDQQYCYITAQTLKIAHQLIWSE